MRRSILVLALVLSACVSMPPGEHGAVSDRLFCGRSIPGGGEVSDADIAKFLDEVVTPRFPGFTSWTAIGSWQGEEEKTLVLEFIHPRGPAFDGKVREIAEEYRRRFRQQAVLRVTEPAQMELIEQ